MTKADRLFALQARMQDGALHRASDLARALNVCDRTIYRDMAALTAAGVPVAGTRGTGYRLRDVIALPPLHLTEAELGALSIALAIVSETPDPDLRGTAETLMAKLDAALPTEATAPADAWRHTFSPHADSARGLGHVAVLRRAIAGRQMLHLAVTGADGTTFKDDIRPLRLAHWARAWVLTGFSETGQDFRDYRLDLIASVTPLPTLFVDVPGKTLADRDDTQ